MGRPGALVCRNRNRIRIRTTTVGNRIEDPTAPQKGLRVLDARRGGKGFGFNARTQQPPDHGNGNAEVKATSAMDQGNQTGKKS
jgi:hypothetical protein